MNLTITVILRARPCFTVQLDVTARSLCTKKFDVASHVPPVAAAALELALVVASLAAAAAAAHPRCCRATMTAAMPRKIAKSAITDDNNVESSARRAPASSPCAAAAPACAAPSGRMSGDAVAGSSMPWHQAAYGKRVRPLSFAVTVVHTPHTGSQDGRVVPVAVRALMIHVVERGFAPGNTPYEVLRPHLNTSAMLPSLLPLAYGWLGGIPQLAVVAEDQRNRVGVRP